MEVLVEKVAAVEKVVTVVAEVVVGAVRVVVGVVEGMFMEVVEDRE